MADSFTMPTLVTSGATKARNAAKATGGVLVITGVAHAIPYTVHVPLSNGSADDEAGRVDTAVHRVLDDTFEMAERVFSPFNSSSTLSRLNAAPTGSWVVITEEFVRVLNLCSELYRFTKGAFDPVAAKSTSASTKWSEGLEWSRAEGGEFQARKRIDGVRLDLSAVSKGWLVDRLAATIAAITVSASGASLEACFVDWGGDVKAVGLHPSGRAWACAVQPPPSARTSDSSTSAIVMTLDLEDAAACTSGSYSGIRPDIVDETGGMKHLVATGSLPHVVNGSDAPHDPSDTIVTCTVVHSVCAVADALATAFASMRSLQNVRSFVDAAGADAWSQLAQTLRLLDTVFAADDRCAIFRIAIVCKNNARHLIDVIAPISTVRPTASLENLRAALAGRLHGHVAALIGIPSADCVTMDGCLGVALTSFVALGRNDSGSPEAAFFSMKSTRLCQIVSRWQHCSQSVGNGVSVFVVFPLTAAAASFLSVCANAMVFASETPFEVLKRHAVESVAVKCFKLFVQPPPSGSAIPDTTGSCDVGTHVAVLLCAGAATDVEQVRDGLPSASASSSMFGRRANEPYAVAVPKSLASKSTTLPNAVPWFAHTAVATVWAPQARGLLATTITNVDFTSRAPMMITFTAKRSRLDSMVFLPGQKIKIHLFDEGNNNEDSLTSWFDDGNAVDSPTQFMYVPGARTAEDADGYTFAATLGSATYPIIVAIVDRVVCDVPFPSPQISAGCKRVIVIAVPIKCSVRWAPRKPHSVSDIKNITAWTIL